MPTEDLIELLEIFTVIMNKHACKFD